MWVCRFRTVLFPSQARQRTVLKTYRTDGAAGDAIGCRVLSVLDGLDGLDGIFLERRRLGVVPRGNTGKNNVVCRFTKVDMACKA